MCVKNCVCSVEHDEPHGRVKVRFRGDGDDTEVMVKENWIFKHNTVTTKTEFYNNGIHSGIPWSSYVLGSQ